MRHFITILCVSIRSGTLGPLCFHNVQHWAGTGHLNLMDSHLSSDARLREGITSPLSLWLETPAVPRGEGQVERPRRAEGDPYLCCYDVFLQRAKMRL